MNEMFAAQENLQILKSTQDNQAKARDPNASPRELNKIKIAQQEISARRDVNAAKYPESFAVQNTAAASAVQAGDWTKAKAYADKAVALAEAKSDPLLTTDALRVRALGAYQAGDFPKAAQDARRALELSPNDRDARVIYQFSKDRVKAGPGSAAGSLHVAAPAGAAWPEGLPLPTAYEDPRVIAAGRRAADRTAAIKKLNEAMRLLGGGSGMAQASLDAASAARRLDPAFADAYMQSALARLAMGDLSKAIEETTRAIGLWTLQGRGENLPAAYALRAKLGNDGRSHRAALADADKALAYDPGFAAAYLQRARAEEALGADVRQTLRDYKRAAELGPNFQADFAAAVTRLSGSAKPAAPAKRGMGREKILFGSSALLAALLAFIWALARRTSPRERLAAPSVRKILRSQYQIVGTLGEGGMGEVFKGWDTVLKRPVAIKKLREELQANERERERFLKEAELVASLHHPHIVDIYNIIYDDAETHLVFEFVSGQTVEQALNASLGRHLPPARALEILRQIAEAVDHAHARQVIHRDLKPSNVMLADGGWVKVMDFGIARQVKDSMLTTTNTIVGTPVYMAPEQAMGAVVKESDVFSLGVTFYELLTGGLPFKGSNEMTDKLQGVFLPPSVLVPDVGAAINAVFARAFSPRASQRYPRCGELYQAAVKALNVQTTSSR